MSLATFAHGEARNASRSAAPAATPHVGIAMALYRPDIEHLRAQLRSIADQSYTSWVCVITADSPLAELGSEIAEFRSDPRFRWHENERRLGVKDNFARAIQLALAEGVSLIAYADQDDVWYANKLATLVEAMEGLPPLSVAHADMDVLVDERPLGVSAWKLERRSIHLSTPWQMLVRNIATGASMVMDAELARRYPVIPGEIRYHDHWYALAASFHGGVHPVAKRLHAYRQHGDNVVGVAPYQGLLRGDTLRTLWRSRGRGVADYRAIRSVTRRAKELGLPVTRLQTLTFHAPFDLGLGFFTLGVMALLPVRFDRAGPRVNVDHAGVCFGLSIAKVLDLLGHEPSGPRAP